MLKRILQWVNWYTTSFYICTISMILYAMYRTLRKMDEAELLAVNQVVNDPDLDQFNILWGMLTGVVLIGLVMVLLKIVSSFPASKGK